MDAQHIVDTYGAAWNETDPVKRRALLDEAWADHGTYLDPMGSADGRDALVTHISGFHEMMPGNRIDATSAVDVHGSVFRFAWAMLDPSGTVALEGMDFGEFDDDGRISRIIGFFGPFPALDG
jgi:hypothetical protein